MSAASVSVSPVTQVADPSSQPAVVEEKVSEDQFNSLHASSVTYRDLLIFEERLKLNMNRLKKRQQKYEAFLGSLILVIAYCAFGTFYQPSPTFYIHALHKFFLLLSCTTLFLFFATGMYSEKLSYSSKFVPQCNRILRVFNMHFNRDNRPELSFFRKVPKKFQEGFSAYKATYFKRKSEKRAAALALAAAGGSGSGNMSGSNMGLTGGRAVNRRLQPSGRGRRAGGGGGGGGYGSASGSDSSTGWGRPALGSSSSSMMRGQHANQQHLGTLGGTRPMLRPSSSSASSSVSSSSVAGTPPTSSSTGGGNASSRSLATVATSRLTVSSSTTLGASRHD